MFYNFYYLGSKVVEKLESNIESRQMKMDISMPFPRQQTANLEAYHSLVDHFAKKWMSFQQGDAESARINTNYYLNELKLCFKLWHYY